MVTSMTQQERPSPTISATMPAEDVRWEATLDFLVPRAGIFTSPPPLPPSTPEPLCLKFPPTSKAPPDLKDLPMT